MYLEIYRGALAAKEYPPAATAVTGIAKLHGLVIDRQQIEAVIRKPSYDPNAEPAMSEAEWFEQFGSVPAIDYRAEPQTEPVQPADAGARARDEMATATAARLSACIRRLMRQGCFGIGVRLCARISEHAASGEIWVSRTVKDLVAGSGLRLEERGDYNLKGITSLSNRSSGSNPGNKSDTRPPGGKTKPYPVGKRVPLAALQVACSHIVDHRVAPDVVVGIFLGNAPAPFPMMTASSAS